MTEATSHSKELPLAGICVTAFTRQPLERDSRIQKESRTLARAGATVRVVTVGTDPCWAHPDFDVVAIPTPDTLSSPYAREQSTIRWRPVRVAENLIKHLFRRVAQRKHMHLIKEALTDKHADVIHAHDLNALELAHDAASHLGARLIYDSHEIWLGRDIPGLSTHQRRRFERIERDLGGTCDAVITVNGFIADVLKAQYRWQKRPFVVMNGPARSADRPTEVHEPVRVLFQGGFHPDRHIVDIIDAVASLDGLATLTLEGGGEEEAELRRYVFDRGLEHIVDFEGWVPVEETVIRANRFDIGVIANKDEGPNYRYCSPNKLFDYVSSGLAIVASDLPFLHSVVVAHDAGIVFDPEDPAALAHAIRSLAHDPSRLDACKQNSHSASRLYSWGVQAKVLLYVYSSVLAIDRDRR